MTNIKKSYGTTTILSGISFALQPGDRAGLVGVNGAGKSTLLKILAGKLTADCGTVTKPKDITSGYLAQSGGLTSQNTIFEELLTVFETLVTMEQQLKDLELAISKQATATGSTPQQLLADYSELTETFKNQDGYSYRAKVQSIINGLKLDTIAANRPVAKLSGGQQTLVALAKLLLQSPDMLMLDEPTNYLDINTLNWLEQYLKAYPGALLLISHDRYLLDKLTNVTYDLEHGKITRYPGNYSQHLVQKAADLALQLEQYQRQNTKINAMEDFIQRNIARASSSKRAQSRRRSLEKVELLAKPVAANKKTTFNFSIKQQSGKEVLTVTNLTTGYRGEGTHRSNTRNVPINLGEGTHRSNTRNVPINPVKTIATGIDFLITRGEHLALIAPNGMGKSTLLKTLAGALKALAGHIKLGTNVQLAYYEQQQADLQSSKQLLAWLWDQYPQLDQKDIRTVLGNFLFSGDDIFKKTNNLSGGEKARLALAKLMLKQANFLILDEPTNHLDIYSREVLENALIDFPGTILFVSHDRYFVNKIATRVLELNKTGIKSYPGNYDYYLLKKQPDPVQIKQNKQKQRSTNDKKMAKEQNKATFLKNKALDRAKRQKQNRLRELQTLMPLAETQITKLKQQLKQPAVYQDHNKCMAINDQLDQLKQELEQYLSEWIALEE